MIAADRKEEDLHSDLLPYIADHPSFGRVLHHPLMIELTVSAYQHGALNHRYLAKRSAVKRALRAQDWHQYVFLHERPYRMGALHRSVAGGLRDADYWQLVGAVWVDCENVHEDLAMWRSTWRSTLPGRNHAMTEKEREAHLHLGDETCVWRGTGHRSSIRSLSWTTNRDTAIWFARRFRQEGRPALLATGVVLRDDAFAMFFGRDESEIVCGRVNITTIEEVAT